MYVPIDITKYWSYEKRQIDASVTDKCTRGWGNIACKKQH